MATGYMIEIQPSVTDSYGVKQGWDKVYDTHAEAEAAKDRAERNDWHSVRVITIEREPVGTNFVANPYSGPWARKSRD